MDEDEAAAMENVHVHEIKFDEFGIMDDGLDDSTAKQLEDRKKERQKGQLTNQFLK